MIELPDSKTYKTILADPPWQLRDRGWNGFSDVRPYRVQPQYPTMPLADIKALGVENVVNENAHLYLWCLNSVMDWGFEVARAWGFDPKTVITWIKTGKGGFGVALGMGHYYRNSTEHCIFAVRGSLRTLRRDIPTVFFAPKGKHSEKPNIFYEYFIERMSPDPYLELFARQRREGWDAWGNEVL